jgi:hypothetical protein
MPERYAIPPERWPECLEQFSRAHAGQAASVCTSGAPAGGAANADQMPLIGIVAEPTKSTSAPSAESPGSELHIMLGRPGGPHVDHVVKEPCRIWAAEWNDGFSAVLEIDADDGSTTLVQIGPPGQLLGEGMVVDGVPPEL